MARLRRYWLPALCVLLCGSFSFLGFWQLQRLAWKQSLLQTVERNVHAAPASLNSLESFKNFEYPRDEYRRVVLSGQPDCARATRVWATTVLGTGYWWMVPVRLSDGTWLWVNRGYVSPSYVAKQQCPVIRIEGLLRASQTGGGFLRDNRPGEGRWYSRDVALLTQQAGLSSAVTVWFVDEGLPHTTLSRLSPESQSRPSAAHADTTSQPEPDTHPVTGLTPLNWPNRHLGYALTWFGLAGACAIAALLLLRRKI